jgi:hypothetical protein
LAYILRHQKSKRWGEMVVSEIDEAIRNTYYSASKLYILCAVLCAMFSALVEFRTAPMLKQWQNE